MTQPVLDIQQLHLSFPGFNGDVHALNNVSLQINRGEIVGLVGESGSGKSVTAMLIMRLLPTGSYCVHRGQISLNRNLHTCVLAWAGRHCAVLWSSANSSRRRKA